jgi:hypothetical protein
MKLVRFTCDGPDGSHGRLADADGKEIPGIRAVTIHAEAGKLTTADVAMYVERVDVVAELRCLTVTLRDGSERSFLLDVDP